MRCLPEQLLFALCPHLQDFEDEEGDEGSASMEVLLRVSVRRVGVTLRPGPSPSPDPNLNP